MNNITAPFTLIREMEGTFRLGVSIAQVFFPPRYSGIGGNCKVGVVLASCIRYYAALVEALQCVSVFTSHRRGAKRLQLFNAPATFPINSDQRRNAL